VANFALQAKVKDLAHNVEFAQNFFTSDISQIYAPQVNNITQLTQINMLDGLGDLS